MDHQVGQKTTPHSDNAPQAKRIRTYKRCATDGCNTRPSYGPPGGAKKDAIYCGKCAAAHQPTFVDVCHNRCAADGCNSQPSYGPPGGSSKDAIYCGKCAAAHQPTFVDVCHNRCAADGCNKIPSYGPPGGAKKDALYCGKCAAAHQPTFVNVCHNRCAADNCNTRPRYNFAGIAADVCSSHKTPGMILRPTARCNVANCKRMPDWGTKDRPMRCDAHRLATDVEHHTFMCGVCGLCVPLLSTQICPECTKDPERVKQMPLEKQRACVAFLQLQTLSNGEPLMLASVDRIADVACGRERPDIVIGAEVLVPIVEVDENQHKGYACECDLARMINIWPAYGGRPVVFIRFNPDSYRPARGVHEMPLHQRYQVLLKWIRIVTHQSYIQEGPLQVIYLFYDGYSDQAQPMTIDIPDFRG